MEAPKTNWTEKDTLIAASVAPRLSALLEKRGLFKCKALSWLKPEHVAKFLDVTDADEARKLLHLSASWHFVSDPNATSGLPLLDELRECSDGWKLVAHLATLEPAWVARWWKWKTKRGSLS